MDFKTSFVVLLLTLLFYCYCNGLPAPPAQQNLTTNGCISPAKECPNILGQVVFRAKIECKSTAPCACEPFACTSCGLINETIASNEGLGKLQLKYPFSDDYRAHLINTTTLPPGVVNISYDIAPNYPKDFTAPVYCLQVSSGHGGLTNLHFQLSD